MGDDYKELTGKLLNELWNIGAKHALYRKKGNWYHLLKIFPAALIDNNGYIVFNTEKEYIDSPYLQIGKELSVPKGIANIPGYKKIIENGNIQEISHKVNVYNKEVNIIENIPEGNTEIERINTKIDKIIRDIKVSKFIKNLYDNRCQICGISIKLSNNVFYSEAHHIFPLNKNGPDVIDNVLCVCPNHHVQLDYGAIRIIKEKLIIIKGHNLNHEYIKYHNEKIFRA